MSLTASPKDPQALRHGTEATIAPEDDALHQGLGPRQLQMIAIGGAIGTGLFLGAGGRLASAGPSLFIAYAVCGFSGYPMPVSYKHPRPPTLYSVYVYVATRSIITQDKY
ncbi:hypothetical protein SA15R_00605, partial [Rothia kristinae]